MSGSVDSMHATYLRHNQRGYLLSKVRQDIEAAQRNHEHNKVKFATQYKPERTLSRIEFLIGTYVALGGRRDDLEQS